MSIAEIFKNQKYVVFNDMLSQEVCSLLTDYPVSMGDDDNQCPLSWSIYGDPMFDTILKRGTYIFN